MKEVIVKWEPGGSPRQLYQSSLPKFCWVCTTSRSKEFRQVTLYDDCRELFGVRMKRYLFPIHDNKKDIKGNLSTNRLMFCVTLKHKGYKAKFVKNWVNDAKKVLNIIEKHLKWGLTKVYKVADSEKDPKHESFIFSASAKWLRAPHLISLYLLLLRISKNRNLMDIKEVSDMEETVAKLRAKVNAATSTRDREDIEHFAALAPYLNLIFDKHKELFFSRSIKDNFKDHCSSHGINALIKCSVSDEPLNTLFRKLKIEYNKKRQAKKA